MMVSAWKPPTLPRSHASMVTHSLRKSGLWAGSLRRKRNRCTFSSDSKCDTLRLYKFLGNEHVEYDDTANHDAVSVYEQIGIINVCLVDNHPVATVQITNVEPVRSVKHFSMQARSRYFREDNIVLFIAPQCDTCASFERKDFGRSSRYDYQRGSLFERCNDSSRKRLCSSRQEQRTISIKDRLACWWRCLNSNSRIKETRCHFMQLRHADRGRRARLLVCLPDLENVGNLAKAYPVIRLESIHLSPLQAPVIHKRSIGTAKVTQQILSIGIDNIGMAA